MMINYIFSFFFITGILYGFITHTNISNEMLLSSNNALSLIFSLVPVICLWTGLMNVAKKSGLLDKFSKLLTPVLKIIFPEIPNNSPCFGYIATNIIMNILGLGSAATSFGLKAIKEMQSFNKDKTSASRSMITFLILNTSSITIMPTSIVSLRMHYGSSNPEGIIPYIIITSFICCIVGLIIDNLFYRVVKK